MIFYFLWVTDISQGGASGDVFFHSFGWALHGLFSTGLSCPSISYSFFHYLTVPSSSFGLPLDRTCSLHPLTLLSSFSHFPSLHLLRSVFGDISLTLRSNPYIDSICTIIVYFKFEHIFWPFRCPFYWTAFCSCFMGQEFFSYPSENIKYSFARSVCLFWGHHPPRLLPFFLLVPFVCLPPCLSLSH